MNPVELEIYGIAPSNIKGSYSLIMEEKDGSRKLPIIIGQYEAHSIAVPLEGINVGRPLTHDLILTIAKNFNFTIPIVDIYKVIEGVFYAQINCVSLNETIIIESRVSDAIAIALRFNAKIITNETVMNEVAINPNENSVHKPGRDSNELNISKPKEKSNLYEHKTIEELEKMLDDAIRNEDYLKAAQIRDEIDRKS